MMIRRLLMLSLLTGLASCAMSNQSETSDRVPQSSSVEPAQSLSLPDIQCRGEIPEALQKEFGEYRLAQPNDFIPIIQEFDQETAPPGREKITYTCSLFTADFNQDEKLDYAALLVNPQTQTAQFRLALNQGGDTFANVVVRDYVKPPQPITETLYVAMFLKASGEKGVAEREYFPLKVGTAEREVFINSTAIEVWLSPYQFGNFPSQYEEEDLNDAVGYGSEVFYFVDGQLKTVSVAD